MKVRIIHYCPRCGSLLFRPAISRILRDSVYSKLGLHPHRCYMCRLRFYLFRPAGLRSLAAALDRPLLAFRGQEPVELESPVEAKRRAMVAGDALPH